MKSSENKNDNNKNDFSIDTIIELCRKNIKYISAGVLFLLLVVILVKCTGANGTDNGSLSTSVSAEAEQSAEDYELDEYPEINELITNYYDAYADGDTDALEKIAYPITDIEKSYIQLFSQYVTSYQNISCYTKSGLDDDSFVVSAYYEMEVDGVKTLAPGLDFFYVTKDEDGNYYIDNAYSQYNLTNKENALDSDIEALIAEFETEDDVLSLQAEVQEKYEKAIESDDDLKKMVDETIHNAISDWVASLSASTEDAAEEDTAEDSTDSSDDSKKDDTEEADESKDDSKDSDAVEDTSEDKTADDSAADDAATDDTAEDTTADDAAAADAAAAETTSETVYATSKVNVREQPNESANVLAEVDASTEFTRTGTTDDGWSAVDYNGTTAYIKSDYLTTDPSTITASVSYIPEGTVIRLTDAVNIRSSMDENASKVGTAFSGEELTVVISYAEGWTKVTWNGKEGYVKTDVID